jgi:Methionine biosynthesis protein MetW
MSTARTELPEPDVSQIERLSTWWRLSGPEPLDGRPVKRVIHRARRFLARVLGPQETFNAAVVDHLKRGVAADQAAIAWAHAAHEELRLAIGVLQHATRTLRHDVERLGSGAPAAGAPSPTAPPASALPAADHTYVGFEDRFRGTQEDIRQRMTRYLPIFAGASDVLDVGCGRGEFLALLRDRGVRARGIDVNRAMVDACRDLGLDATHADAVSYLQSLPDASLGGLIAAQVVEHLEPRYLMALLDAVFAKLRPGAPVVLETINPACWSAFFDSYIRDITHVQPVHPDTLHFLLVATGFQQVEISYGSPYPDEQKLQPVPDGSPASPPGWARTLNANAERINSLLFSWRDYAAIGRRP